MTDRLWVRRSAPWIAALAYIGSAAAQLAPRIESIDPPPGVSITSTDGLPLIELKLTQPVALPAGTVRLLSTTSSQPLAFSATIHDNGRVIRIELAQPAQFDRVTLIIDYAAAGLDGLELDGEIDNPDNPTLPSGDGTRGGQAVFRFNVLPGDLDRDGDVDLFDLARLLTNFQTAFPVTPTDGDLNSDGRVDLPDLAVMLTTYGLALPPLGATQPAVGSTTPSVALFDDLAAMNVRFSEPMASQLDPRAVFAIDEAGVLHAASSVTVAADRREATFGFAAAIPQCQDVRVYIGNALTSATGQFLSSPAPSDLSGFVAPPTPIVNAFPQRTTNQTVALSGVATGAVTLEVSGPTGVVSFPVNAADQFSGNVTIGQNRANQLFLTPISACGVRGAPRTINITHDVQPPTLFVDFPDTQSPVVADSTDIAGRVADLLSGFVGLTVTVNGQPAQVFEGIGTNGSFFLPAFPLNVGDNPVTVIATDALGNQATRNVVITREEIPADAPRMEIISGNAQAAPMHGLLPQPVVVRVTRSTGAPIAGKVVTFDVTRSDGRLYAAPPIGDEPGELMVQVQTDAAGLARAYWRVGADAGEGNNRVCALSRDIAGTVFFCASTLPGAAAQINIGTGNNQRAETGSPAPEPLRAWVSDACNGIVGVPVTFTVASGNGRIVGPGGQLVSTLTVPTSGTGHAAVEFILGDEPGNNAVEANFVGNAGNPATFVVFGLRRDEARPTTFSGLILDNSSNPLGGAGVRLFVNRSPVAETFSDDQGQFRFDDVPSSGHADVFIDAATIDLVAGQPLPADTRYPDMHYETIVVPNSDNSLSMPVLLPPLKVVNDRVYRWNQPTDLALTSDGMAGLKMIVKVGTTIVLPPGPGRPNGAIVGPNHPPDGTAERPGEVTLAINQVHHDEIPMPMPDGASPPFAWTFQPGGSHFDIPVAIEYPNMSALPAGALSNFLSFNHETNRFEIIATGTVAADGSVIRSDAGVGITVSGWGGNCPPYPVSGDVESEPCRLIREQADRDCEERRGTPLGAFPCQISCLAERNCDAQTPEWIVESLRYTTERRASGPSAADEFCDRIMFDFPLSTRYFALCYLFEGWLHLSQDLYPAWRDNCSELNTAEHLDQLLNALIPCSFEAEGAPLPVQLASAASVPFIATGLRIAVQVLCPFLQNRDTSFPELPPHPSADELFSPGLASLSQLQVVVDTNEFFLYAGEDYQLSVFVTHPDGTVEDVASSDNTRYLVIRNELDAVASASGDGMLHVHRTTGVTPASVDLLWIAVEYGETVGLGQFCILDSDSDADLINDSVEDYYGLDSSQPNFLWNDQDDDGVVDIDECFRGTSPVIADTDGDGALDGVEVDLRSDPLDPNSTSGRVRGAVSLSLAGQSSVTGVSGRFRLRNISSPDDFGPDGPGSPRDQLSDDFLRVTGTASIDGVTYFAFSEPFQIRQGETYILDDLTITTTPPFLPEQLRFGQHASAINEIGDTVQLSVTAVFPNGSTLDVTNRSTWTTYRTSNPAVATIGRDGLITAVGRGRAFITAVNSGTTAVTQIDVVPDDPLTTITGLAQLEDGTLVAGAEISVVATSATGTSGPDGVFFVAGLPSLGGALDVVARAEINGDTYEGDALGVVPVPGGFSDAGLITLRLRQIDITPRRPWLTFSQTVQFAATVAGTTNQAVTWTLEAPAGSDATTALGIVSTLGLYTPPPPNSASISPEVIVRARSVALPDVTDTTRVRLVGTDAAPQVVQALLPTEGAGANLPLSTVAGSPSVSVVLPTAGAEGQLATNTIAASPPVSVMLPTAGAESQLATNTVSAVPSISVMLPTPGAESGLRVNTVVAQPIVWVIYSAPGIGALPIPLNTTVANPPIEVEIPLAP